MRKEYVDEQARKQPICLWDLLHILRVNFRYNPKCLSRITQRCIDNRTMDTRDGCSSRVSWNLLHFGRKSRNEKVHSMVSVYPRLGHFCLYCFRSVGDRSANFANIWIYRFTRSALDCD